MSKIVKFFNDDDKTLTTLLNNKIQESKFIKLLFSFLFCWINVYQTRGTFHGLLGNISESIETMHAVLHSMAAGNIRTLNPFIQSDLVIRNVLKRNKLVLRNHFPRPKSSLSPSSTVMLMALTLLN